MIVMKKNDENRFAINCKITRFLCVLLCAVFAFALFGCQNKDIDELRDAITRLEEENEKLREEIEDMKTDHLIYGMNEPVTVYYGAFPIIRVTLIKAELYGEYNGEPELTLVLENISSFTISSLSLYFISYEQESNPFMGEKGLSRIRGMIGTMQANTSKTISVRNIHPTYDKTLMCIECYAYQDQDAEEDNVIMPVAIFHYAFS